MPLISILGISGGSTTPDFNPASLFSGGEDGVWFDFNDRGSLFTADPQDRAAGSFSPAAGTKVLGVIDKSRLGSHTDVATWYSEASELATNADISSDTGWTTAGAVAYNGGEAGYEWDGSTGTQEIYQSVTTANGDWFIAEIVTGTVTGGSARIVIGTSGTTADESTFDIDTGSTTYHFMYPSTTAGSTFRIQSNDSAGNYFDGIIVSASIKALPGNTHLFSESDGPTLRQDGNSIYYLEFDGVNDILHTGTGRTTVMSSDSIWCFAAAGNNDGNLATGISYGAGVNTRILWGMTTTGGYGDFTPALTYDNLARVWEHDASTTAVNIYEFHMDDTLFEITVRMNDVEELAATTVDLGQNSNGTLEFGDAIGYNNQLSCDIYGLIIYEGSTFDSDVYDWTQTEFSL